MAGLYQRGVDPSFATPGGISAASPNAGLGVGAAGLPRTPEDNFDPAQLAGILGLIGKGTPAAATDPAQAAAPQGYDISPNMPGGALYQQTPSTPVGQYDFAQAAQAPVAQGGFDISSAMPTMSNPVVPSLGTGVPVDAAKSALIAQGIVPDPTKLQGILGVM